MRRTTLASLALLAISTRLAAQSDTIDIKGHARVPTNQPVRALLYGELDGKRVVLQCVLSHPDCKELPRGQYNIERLLEGEGSYLNCPNVDLYRLNAGSFQDEPLGEYCLQER